MTYTPICYPPLTKRVIDLIGAVLALLVLSPILVGTAILVRVLLGSPVLFRQVRPGFQGQPFEILKFRTMTDVRDTNGLLLADAKRLTRFGRFLRSTSLDEFPELFNVLKGDMSLVGPRPLLTRYLPYYTPTEMSRHSVRPGITGWAQIHGRNLASWDDRLKMDVWYVENWTIGLDLKVILRTLLMAVRRSGVVPDARSIMMDLDEEREGRATPLVGSCGEHAESN